jgi:hypothetical protein
MRLDHQFSFASMNGTLIAVVVPGKGRITNE